MSEHVVLMKGVRNGWNLLGILQALGGRLLGVIVINTQCFVRYNRDVRQRQEGSVGCSRDEKSQDLGEVPLRKSSNFYLLLLLNSAKDNLTHYITALERGLLIET